MADRWWPGALPHTDADSVSSLQGLGQSCVCICSLSRATGLLKLGEGIQRGLASIISFGLDVSEPLVVTP